MKPKLDKLASSGKETPLVNKQYFIGIALGENNTVETGITVLDRSLNLVRVEKLFTNTDIELFISNFNGKHDSIICVSLPSSNVQVNSKWRQSEKNIHAFKLFECAEELTWTERFSDRGQDICEKLKTLNITVFRYNIYLTKMRLGLIPPFKTRSQPGCKYLQTVIKDSLSVNNLPSNLLPISALDAVIGSYSGWKVTTDKEGKGYIFADPFRGQEVVLPIKTNPRPVSQQEVKVKSKKK